MKVKKINNRYQVRKMIKGKAYYFYFENKPSKKDIDKLILDKKLSQEEIKKKLYNCIEEYLEEKNNILSPSTIRRYKSILKNLPQKLASENINNIDTQKLQSYINDLAKTSKAKTIKNIISLILVSIKYFEPTKNFILQYPPRIKTTPYIPTDQDIKKIDTYLKDTKYYIFFRLCLYGLRVSEILALTKEDITSNGLLKITKAKVLGYGEKYFLKGTKTTGSNREIKIDKDLQEEIQKNENIIDITYKQFYRFFIRTLKHLKIPRFSPHKLRHYIASKMHDLNIPQKYIMEFGGWTNPQTLNNIYTHTFENKKTEYCDLIKTEINKIIKP